MPQPRYRTVTRRQGNNAAVKDGKVRPESFAFEFEEVDPLIRAFRQMVRELEYDICEMALTTYVCARAHGVRFTALPIFLVRGFHHGAIRINKKAGIATAKDLEGRRVGVNRGYTVTTGVWARAVLQDEYDVDLSRVTWVLSGDEHVAQYKPPENVVPMEAGQDMAAMVKDGELAGVINLDVEHPDVEPLIADPLEAGLSALKKRGHYPINHLLVVRDSLLERHPEIAPETFAAFAESKRLYVEKLQSGGIEKPTKADELYRRVMNVTGDPLPYGIEPNRAVLEELISHAVTQKIIGGPVSVESLFAENTRGLTG